MPKTLKMPDLSAQTLKPAPDAKATPARTAGKPGRPAGGAAGRDAREWATTTLRFRPPTLKRLKRAALDRDQSFQEMVEEALYKLLRAEGVVVPGLREGER